MPPLKPTKKTRGKDDEAINDEETRPMIPVKLKI